jgi:hypothetical protein
MGQQYKDLEHVKNVFDDITIERDGYTEYRRLPKSEVRGRMSQLVPQALRTLEYNMRCGDARVEVMAATAVLDRAGYGVQSKVTIDESRDDLSSLTREELAARAAAVARQLLTQKKREVQQGPFEESDTRSVH